MRAKSGCCDKGKNRQQGKLISLHVLIIEAILIFFHPQMKHLQ
jgi:hypothetical protein